MYSKDEAKEIRLEFWQKLESKTRRLPGQKGRSKRWLLDNTGIKGIDLRFDVNRDMAMVALEINHKDESRRLMLFEKLDACKSLFEQSFGSELTWDLLYDKDNGLNVSRIYSSVPCDIYNKESWSAAIKFMIDNMIRLETAFLEVKDFLKYDELGQ
jgi:hypothetical protein